MGGCAGLSASGFCTSVAFTPVGGAIEPPGAACAGCVGAATADCGARLRTTRASGRHRPTNVGLRIRTRDMLESPPNTPSSAAFLILPQRRKPGRPPQEQGHRRGYGPVWAVIRPFRKLCAPLNCTSCAIWAWPRPTCEMWRWRRLSICGASVLISPAPTSSQRRPRDLSPWRSEPFANRISSAALLRTFSSTRSSAWSAKTRRPGGAMPGGSHW